MTGIAVTLLWCVIQVTVVAAAAVVTCLLFSRGGASIRTGVALAGLMIAAFLAPLAFSPWPSWESLRQTTKRTAVADGEATQAVAEPRTDGRVKVPERSEVGEDASVWSAAWGGFIDGLNEAPVASRDVPEANRATKVFPWRTAIAWLFVAASIMGVLRVALGLWSVRRMNRRAKPIYDPTLFGMVDVLRAELSCLPRVELKQSHEVATAAMTGWRRPVVFLPSDWSSWTEDERRAVLAHELAHVKQRDYVKAIAGQIALAVHFYHPLLHWLAHRLRLDQELAADALAASVSGGRAAYLKTLAELALRRADGRVAWPARAFLPTRRTFLRRIEMLRDPQRSADRPAPLLRTLAIAGLLLFGVTVAGFRPVTAQNADQPAEGNVAADEDGGNADANNATKPAEVAGAVDEALPDPLAYAPPLGTIVASARVAELMAKPELKKAAEMAEQVAGEMTAESWRTLQAAGVQLKNLDRAILVHVSQSDAKSKPSWILRLNTPIDTAVLEKAAEGHRREVIGRPVFQLPPYGTFHSSQRVAVPDARTLLISESDDVLRLMLMAGRLERIPPEWKAAAESDPDVIAFFDTAMLSDVLRDDGPPGSPSELIVSTLAPLLSDAKTGAVAITLDEPLSLRMTTTSGDAAAAERVASTLRAVVTLAGNALRQLEENVRRAPPEERAVMSLIIPIGEQLLSSAKIETEGVSTVLTAEATDAASVATLTSLLAPAIAQAREAANRTRSMNNLRQIALAFHNYHDTYQFFPPAVIEENGVKRSWRVEILPFLEQGNLYGQYRKNEPWDSDHNKTILQQMPLVFKDPSDPSPPNTTSYYLLTSDKEIEVQDLFPPGIQPPPARKAPLTLFSSKPIGVTKGGKGPRIGPDITDGASNTLMVVEAKRAVPWTKPEDIPFDPAKIDELLKNDLGGNHPGGFIAAFCDGLVRFVSENIDRNVFKALVTPSGNEVVTLPESTPPQSTPQP